VDSKVTQLAAQLVLLSEAQSEVRLLGSVGCKWLAQWMVPWAAWSVAVHISHTVSGGVGGGDSSVGVGGSFRSRLLYWRFGRLFRRLCSSAGGSVGGGMVGGSKGVSVSTSFRGSIGGIVGMLGWISGRLSSSSEGGWFRRRLCGHLGRWLSRRFRRRFCGNSVGGLVAVLSEALFGGKGSVGRSGGGFTQSSVDGVLLWLGCRLHQSLCWRLSRRFHTAAGLVGSSVGGSVRSTHGAQPEVR
jgi:hypothetical protein